MNNKYTFVRIINIEKVGIKDYVTNWPGGNANGTSIESLVNHLVLQKRVINFLEGDFVVPDQTILYGEVLREGASAKDLKNFYKIGKNKGVVIG